MIEFPSAAADRAVLAALEEDAAACDLTTQWSVPDGLVSEATIISRALRLRSGSRRRRRTPQYRRRCYGSACRSCSERSEAGVADFGSSAEERVAPNAAV